MNIIERLAHPLSITFSVAALGLGAVGLTSLPSQGAVVQTCNGKPVTVEWGVDPATGGADVILGTPDADTIDGMDGNDTICGLEGNDVLIGSDGRDTLIGNEDVDELRGGNHRDRLEGGQNGDYLYGGAGNDTLVGGGGPNQLFGESGDDRLNCGPDGGDWGVGGSHVLGDTLTPNHDCELVQQVP